jgi:hypothetical protein
LLGLIIITATGSIGLIASPTMADKAGMIEGAIIMITNLAGMADGAMMTEMTTIALAIPSSVITARGGRASTAKHEGRGELAPPPEVSDGHA